MTPIHDSQVQETKETRPRRRRQARALETHANILHAATELFSTLGFEGATVRQIEEAAQVQRGLIAYHFGDKDALWRAVVDRLFAGLKEEISRHVRVLKDVAASEASRALLKAFVRYSAANPQLNRLIMQESVAPSWRVTYFTREHIRPLQDHIGDLLRAGDPSRPRSLDPHFYYIFVGAGAFVFSVEHECEELFGVNPRTDEFVERHATLLADLFFPTKD